MVLFSTQLLKPNTWESSLRPVFILLLLFNLMSKSCLLWLYHRHPISGLLSPPLSYHPSAHHHYLLSRLLQIFSQWPSCFHFHQPFPTVHYCASNPLLSSYRVFLSTPFSWQGLCTCCSCLLEWSDPTIFLWFSSLSFRSSSVTSSKMPSLWYSTTLFHITLLIFFIAHITYKFMESVYLFPRMKSPWEQWIPLSCSPSYLHLIKPCLTQNGTQYSLEWMSRYMIKLVLI